MADIDFSDLGAQPVADFSDLGATPVDEITQGESVLAGAQQGLTLGHGDEFQGLVEGGMDAAHALFNKLGIAGPSVSQVNEATDAPGPQSILDMYRQARDASRQQFSAAEDANPKSFMGGAIAGGALTSAVAPTAIMNPLGSAAKTAPLLQKITQGAANAVPGAAIGSAGVSEADLTQGQVGQFVGDVAQGTALGAGIGGALPIVGAAVSAPMNAIGQSKIMQDLLDSYRTGIEQLDMSSPRFLKESRDKLKDIASQVDDKMREAKDKLFGQKKVVMDELERSGARADTKSVVQGLADFEGSSNSLRAEERSAIQNTTGNLMKEGFLKTPQQLENAINDLGDLKTQVQTPSAFKYIDDSIKALRGIRDQMDPRLGNINKELNHVIDTSEALMNRGATEYGTGSADLGTREKLASLFESGTKYKTESTLDDILNKGLQTSKNVDINPLKQTVPEAANLVESTLPIVRRMELAKGMQKPTFNGSNMITSTINAVKTSGTNVANKAGMAVAANKEFLQKGIQRLSDSTPDQIKQLSSRLVTIGGEKGAQYAKILNDSITKNNVSKNAIMFGLMQQPEFRDMLRGTMEQEVENVEDGN